MTMPEDIISSASRAFDHSTSARRLLEMTGIQEILNLPGITEVAVNEPGTLWFERGNGWESVVEARCTYERCMALAMALAVFSDIPWGIDAKNPVASVILPDGERGQIVIAPATHNGVVSITLRKPSQARFNLSDYASQGRLSGAKKVEDGKAYSAYQQMAEQYRQNQFDAFFKLAIENRLNILIVGGTGSGKTTFSKALADLYPPTRRIITIEDVHELTLPNHPNHVHLFFQRGGNTPEMLIESAMRMKPDHVLLAELRGAEAWSYIELLNTGHAGSITTIHANDCVSAFARIANLVKRSEVAAGLGYDFVLKCVKDAIDVVCFFDRGHMTEILFEPKGKFL
jgi:type IV secretion system protein VirB11